MDLSVNLNVLGWSDRLAVSASTLCALHCLGLPFLVGVFPVISGTVLGDEAFHQWLIWGVVPLSGFSLLLGCRKHKNAAVIYFGLVGVGALIASGVLGHAILGEAGERWATLAGAVLLAVAHIKNFRLCRQSDCDH
jgi:hypothetical protein